MRPELIGLEQGTRAELRAVWRKAFHQEAPASAMVDQLRASLLTAMTRLRLDFEVMMLRGKALNHGETVR
jgi:hypothetical protein